MAREIQDEKSIVLCFKKSKTGVQQVLGLLKQMDAVDMNKREGFIKAVWGEQASNIELGIYIRREDLWHEYWEMFCEDQSYISIKNS